VDITLFLRYTVAMIDTRFATALQIVMSVASDETRGLRCTSSTLAERLNTNPSFIRKLLGPMISDGLLISTPGNGGGIKLTRAASKIRLNEIYKAVSTESPLWNARDGVPSICFISSNIGRFTNSLCEKAERAVVASLAEFTVTDAIAELERLSDEQDEPAQSDCALTA
jgi:Rrf2 family transcriptional repressor of oqxAB